jgi:hypothetical protein
MSLSLPRILGCWLLLAVLMSANGIVRELVLRPRVGAAQADVLSAVIGTAVILTVTAYAFRPLAGAGLAELARISTILVALTVAFEFLFGHYVDGRSWRELAGNYAIWRGRLWPAVLVIVALTPFIWGRWAPYMRPAAAESAAVAGRGRAA